MSGHLYARLSHAFFHTHYGPQTGSMKGRAELAIEIADTYSDCNRDCKYLLSCILECNHLGRQPRDFPLDPPFMCKPVCMYYMVYIHAGKPIKRENL